MQETVLVAGGAGYIGSTVADELVKSGRRVVVVDNLIHGHLKAIPQDCIFEKCAIQDTDRLVEIMQKYDVKAVVNFAAFIEVGESMKDPGSFFANNTFGTLSILQAMVKADVKRIVFSSTAAVYGEPDRIPITEDLSLHPENAYGESKLLVERMLAWFERIHGVRSARLRYFNAAGATVERGEDHHPESHLIPLIIQAAMGQRPYIAIFGNDYKTFDGTCVRDYVHILDLASAHILALEALEERGNLVYNLGSGQGFSVRQVIEATKEVSGVDFAVKEMDRRPGDPAYLIASSEKIRRELGWKPKFDDIKAIVKSAWEWRSQHPQGYED